MGGRTYGRFVIGSVAVLVLIAGFPVAATGLPPKLDPRVLTGPSPRAIVGFEHDVTASSIRRLSKVGIRRARVFHAIDAVVVRGPHSAYRSIARWDDVAWVDDDSRISFDNYQGRSTTRVDEVRAGAAPLETGYTGSGLTVAVVDSGVNNLHPDLADQIETNVNMEPGPALDDISDGAYSETYAEAPIGTDELGHGTHVAGTVAGTGKAAKGADMTGVATGARMVNCKLGLSQFFEWSALACYQWILDHRNEERFGEHGIRVATNSWHLTNLDRTPARPLEDMLRKVVGKGITVLFAAGNTGPEANTAWGFEVALKKVITVGAACKAEGSDEAMCPPLGVAKFSGRGPQVDVIAPGVGIWSTKTPGVFPAIGVIFPQSNTTTPGEPSLENMMNNQIWYTPASGTSMATPHTAGIVALMLEANPNLTPKQVQEILKTTARDSGEPGFDNDTGWGLVDALAAVAMAEDLRE